MNDWQPIETTPKDGTRILTFGRGHGNHCGSYDCNDKGFPMYSIAYWSVGYSERDIPVAEGLFRKEKYVAYELWRTEFGYEPTHWMPLPNPPIIAGMEKELRA